MDSFLMLVGIVGILVFGIMAIVSLVKKTGKAKKNVTYTGISFIIMASSLIFQPTAEEASTTIDGETVMYEELVAKIDDKEKELSDIETKLTDIEAHYKEKETELIEATKIVEDKTNAQKELDDLNGQVKTKQDEVKGLDGKLKSKNDELASLQGKITKAAGEPKTLGAGQYIVGTDVPAGRYTVTPIGDGSNFFVHGDVGVNTILGNYGEESYTFFTSDGDVIETRAKVKLTPVE